MVTEVRSTVKFRTAWVGIAFGIVMCAAFTLAAQKKGAASSGGSILAQDKGKFAIKLDGQTIGHEEFEIAPSGGGWLAKGTTDLKPPEGGASKVTGSLTLQADGAPHSYYWTSPAEKTKWWDNLFANCNA